jgi:hypothetical protein
MLQPMKTMTLPAARSLRLFATCAGLMLTAAFAHSASAQVAAPGTVAVKPGSAAALAPGTGPSYSNSWDFYGGLSLMNGQAGQQLPKRYNMGGGELEATYWLGSSQDTGFIKSRLGLTGDVRFEAGTTPVLPNQYNLNRVLVQQAIGAGGVSLRGPKNRYAAVDLHAIVGASHGVFDHAIVGYPPSSVGVAPPTVSAVGLYSNRTTPWGAWGGSIDFNQGKKWAVRLSPDMIFEHFGTETREYFSISGGVLYRFGNKK